MQNKYLSTEEKARFEAKYEVDEKGCWVWQGPLDKDGYGTFYLQGKGRRAHRVAWILLRGPIPADHVINHVCKNRACVNAQHLQVLTREQNNLQDSLSIPAINKRKSHCKNGHPFDKEYTNPKGKTQRICSICEREKQRRNKKKRRENDPLKGII